VLRVDVNARAPEPLRAQALVTATTPRWACRCFNQGACSWLVLRDLSLLAQRDLHVSLHAFGRIVLDAPKHVEKGLARGNIARGAQC